MKAKKVILFMITLLLITLMAPSCSLERNAAGHAYMTKARPYGKGCMSSKFIGY